MSTATQAPVGVSSEHITKTPGVCGGRACIAGHRIRVMDIVAYHEKWGVSAFEIVTIFSGITQADVYAALAYYHDHKDEIDAEFAADKHFDERGRLQPSKLKEFKEALREQLRG